MLRRIAALVKQVWGKPRVIAARDPEAALARIGVYPDFSVTGGTAADYAFLHRSLSDGELYFVRHATQTPERIEARFRVTGKQPEIWRAIDGSAALVSYRTEGKDTAIPLDAGPEDAFFVLFRPTTRRDQSDLHRRADLPPRCAVTPIRADRPGDVGDE